MIDLVHTLHDAKAFLAAHPEAVHYTVTAFHWLRDGFGALRTLDWAWKKFRTQVPTPTTTTTVTMTKTITMTMTIEEKQEHKAA